ncbi:hypothetical protein T439DRAFT_6019 [Meredithblackwellia eburnea MCA 4105]
MQNLSRRLANLSISSASKATHTRQFTTATASRIASSSPSSSSELPQLQLSQNDNPYLHIPKQKQSIKPQRYSANSSRIKGRSTRTTPRKSLSHPRTSEHNQDEVAMTGQVQQSTTGHVKIYLPSVFIRLVRNTGQHAQDPFTATFRTDLRLTKPDIATYLRNIYGLAITSIRTVNYVSPLKRNPVGGGYSRSGGVKNYKKVVVTMDEPFWYPEERGREWCNEHFQREIIEEHRDRKMLRIGDGQKYGVGSWRYRGAQKSKDEVARLKRLAQGAEDTEKEVSDGRSALRKPSGRKMRKNVLRSRAEKADERKSVVLSEVEKLREGGW